jgi:hypothetical protein
MRLSSSFSKAAAAMFSRVKLNNNTNYLKSGFFEFK